MIQLGQPDGERYPHEAKDQEELNYIVDHPTEGDEERPQEGEDGQVMEDLEETQDVGEGESCLGEELDVKVSPFVLGTIRPV